MDNLVQLLYTNGDNAGLVGGAPTSLVQEAWNQFHGVDDNDDVDEFIEYFNNKFYGCNELNNINRIFVDTVIPDEL